MERARWARFEVRTPDRLEQERVLEAVIVPFGETTFEVPFAGGERFVRGAFAGFLDEWRSAEGKRRRRPVPLLRNHDTARPVGVARRLEETEDGLVGEFHIPESAQGDEVLAEVRSGLLDSVSVGFRAVEDRRADDGAREVLSAHLFEASLVPIGAFEGAFVTSVRRPQSPRFSLPKAPRIDPNGWLT
jgi:HK97 family phage prohead protease